MQASPEVSNICHAEAVEEEQVPDPEAEDNFVEDAGKNLDPSLVACL